MKSLCMVFVESNTSGTGRLFVQEARRQGLRPLLLAENPSLYPFIQDEDLQIVRADTRDPRALLEACRRLERSARLAGVWSSSDYFVDAAARLAHELGLEGPCWQAVRDCRDKGLQRHKLQAASIGIPGYCNVSSVSEAVSAADGLGFPVVVKPVQGSGSCGVRLCRSLPEVEAQAGLLLAQTRNERGFPMPRRILIEELVEGPEYSAETLGLEIFGITEKRLGGPPHFVEIGHNFPAGFEPSRRAALDDFLRSSLQALGLGWGPAHLEFRLTRQGPKIIEVNPRLAGGHIPALVRLASGIDLIAATIHLATGNKPALQRTAGRHSAIRFLVPPRAGWLRQVSGLQQASQLEGVHEVSLYSRLGAPLLLNGDFRDRIGHVITAGDDAARVRMTAEQACRLVKLQVEELKTGTL